MMRTEVIFDLLQNDIIEEFPTVSDENRDPVVELSKKNF